jgi:hypothetical protein
VFHFNSRQSRLLFVFHFNSRRSRLFMFHFNSRQSILLCSISIPDNPDSLCSISIPDNSRISHKELRNRFHSLYDPLSSSSTKSGADLGIVERKASEVRNLYFRCAGGAQRAES